MELDGAGDRHDPGLLGEEPDVSSLSSGTQSGTWARKALRAKVRWLTPTKTSMPRRTFLEIFLRAVPFILAFYGGR
jgi:hypothetical protein